MAICINLINSQLTPLEQEVVKWNIISSKIKATESKCAIATIKVLTLTDINIEKYKSKLFALSWQQQGVGEGSCKITIFQGFLVNISREKEFYILDIIAKPHDYLQAITKISTRSSDNIFV